MPFDPHAPSTASPALASPTEPRPPEVEAEPKPYLRDHDWQTAHREWLPYWQQRDPVPPQPETPPEVETPGEVLTERQEAFCRAYLECPVAGKAARMAGYSAAGARQQASRLLKHPLVIRRLHELRAVRGAGHQVQRDTIIDQAEAVYEAAMEKHDYYAAMQALTMKARLAGFADYLPGVRIIRREAGDHEQEFWARAHAAEQRIMAARLGALAGGPIDRAALLDAQGDAAMFAESAETAAKTITARESGEAERRARAKR